MLKYRFLTGLMLVLATFAADASHVCAQTQPAKPLPLPTETFQVADHRAFIFWPEPAKRHTPQPWIFYAPTLPGIPDQIEVWMDQKFLDAGVAVAGIDAGESYGSPAGRELFSALYNELTTKKHFAPKAVLLCRSRGGLQAASWAADHPDHVAALAGIYPVFDLRSYPGLDKAAPAYGLTPQALADQLDRFNPIERVPLLAAAHIPVFLIHGDNDTIVPLEKNSAEFVKRYQAHGAEKDVTLTIAPGQGHNGWLGFFRCQPLIDFAIAHAIGQPPTTQPAQPQREIKKN